MSDQLQAFGFNPVATEEDIRYCFRLILGRDARREEWPGHSSRAGERLADVVASFVNSLEFHNRRLLKPTEGKAVPVHLDGFSMYADSDDLAVGKHLIALRDYEPHVSGLFRECLQPGMRIVDIGANIGFYSLLSASRVGASGVVWAIEPNPANVRLLLASRALNHFTNLHVIQAAAHRSWEILELFADHTNGSVAPASSSDLGSIQQTVMGVPVSSILRGERVDVVKIDVEGAEGSALQGMLDVIDHFKPAVFTEFTPTAMPGMSGMTGDEYLRIFIDRGYRLHLLSTTGKISCGRDDKKLMNEFRRTGLAHVDLFCEP